MVPKETVWFWDGHPWFQISTVNSDGKVLCVNLTSMDAECPDDECILTPSDYSWIAQNHPTVVAFARAKLIDAAKLFAAFETGKLPPSRPPTMPASTLAKVIGAAKRSRYFSER